jgi:hypothetical protein
MKHQTAKTIMRVVRESVTKKRLSTLNKKVKGGQTKIITNPTLADTQTRSNNDD